MSQSSAGKAQQSYAKQLLSRYSDTALQVLVQGGTAAVGTGFWVILNTLGTIAYWQRKFHPVPAPLRTIEAARQRRLRQFSANTTCNDDDAAGDKLRMRPAVTIRAVAGEPQSVVPLHLPAEPELGEHSEAWQLVGPYLRLYGRSAIANSQLQNPEFQHFFVPGVGSLPYVVADIYHRVIVSAIGDPLCHESKWGYITELFMKEFPDAFFYHISEKYAKLLTDLGYWVNDVGAETTLQVQSWTYGPKTRTVRAAARSARDAGVRVRELKPEELTDDLKHRLQHEISGDWLQQKAVAERVLRVFVRHVDYDNLQLRDGVRIFVAEQFHPDAAPPAVVDPVLQGLPANVKPPKPPRNKSSRSLASQNSSSSLNRSASGMMSRSDSVMTSASSVSSLSGLAADSSLELMASGSFSAAAAAAGGGAAAGRCDIDPLKPEMLGFVLLDPVWENNLEVGYVSSICRMKRTAHQGTLKLLYETIISKLRQEGRQELAFGFAPFFNVQDKPFKGRFITWIRWTNLFFYHCCNNLYAFKNLAFSKIRYGAGVTSDGQGFRDPNVKMTHIYMASRTYAMDMKILDLYILCMYVGFMAEMSDTLFKLVGLRKGGANLDHGGFE